MRQVFRRWNLDERRVEEWQSLVVGHGATPSVADPVREGQNTLIRHAARRATPPQPAGRDVAEAMGWLPLWRAWLNVAGDATADAGAAVVHAQTPSVTLPAWRPHAEQQRAHRRRQVPARPGGDLSR